MKLEDVASVASSHGFGRRQSWHICGYYPSIYLEGLMKYTGNLSR
jgi:hypothetical protein